VGSPFLVDRGGSVMRKYGIGGPPATVVLDGSGAVRWVSPPGEVSPDVIREAARQAATACGPPAP
jgi:hypothetical protein